MQNLSLTSYNICKNFRRESVIQATTFVFMFIKKGPYLHWNTYI